MVVLCVVASSSTVFAADVTIPSGTTTAAQTTQANSTLTNNGVITCNSCTPAISSASTNAVIVNNGSITSSSSSIGAGINNTSTGISITNNTGGVILGNDFGITNQSGSVINNITNNGAIYSTLTTGGAAGISTYAGASVITINNAQGGNNATASQSGLTYAGVLPTNYNIIVNSTTHYGQLYGVQGTLSNNAGIGINFGISDSSTLAATTYSSVLTGITSAYILSGSLSGSYAGGYSWRLVNSSTAIWDLVVTGGPAYSGESSSNSSSANVFSATNSIFGDGSTLSGYTSDVVLSSGAVLSGANLSGSTGAAPPKTTVTISSGSIIAGQNAVTNFGNTYGVVNNGVIVGGAYGVYNAPQATIIYFRNNGLISGGIAGVANLSPNTINLLVNNGVILGGIDNTQGRIIALQNSQGGNIPLALSGNLPNNYQIIVNGLSSYGQLAVTKPTGQMYFGIALGSLVYTGLTYTSVLTGIGSNNLLNTAGSSAGYLFKLVPETNGTVWNMTIGASVVDTQSSLQSTASALQNQYETQSNGLIVGLTYDCNLFGENGMCVSAGGRQTGSSSFINGTNSALLIGAYKVSSRLRVGAYLDQNLSASNPNGIISNNNSTPMGGLFAVWNNRDDGLGMEVKASVGYSNKEMTITRPVVGSSEPGGGSTALTSQGANVVAKYNFGIDTRTTFSPYVGARYLSTVMNGYSEGQASNVLVPLAYSSLSMSATTALAGVGANHRLDEAITLSASAGMEADLQATNGSYTVTNVNGLSPVALNPNPNKVRPTVTAAAYYKLHKDAQIGLSVLYRQDSMSGMSSTTGVISYTMGI